MPRENSRIPGAAAGIDGETVLTLPVRKERLKRSKKEIAEEAAKVISQADKVGCIANDKGKNIILIPIHLFTFKHFCQNAYTFCTNT